MVNVRPAMVAVPLREVPVLAETAMSTFPLPRPVPSPLTVIHPAPDVDVHAQPEVVVTCTWTLPADADIDCVVGEIEYVHDTAASCEAVNVRPAIVTVPERAVPVFAATVIVAGPVALPAPDTVSHGALLDDVHAHPLVVVT